MQRLAIPILLLSPFWTGCGQHPETPTIHTIELFGGRYFVEIESLDSPNLSSRIDYRKDGKDAVVELAEYQWGNNALKLDKGKLTLNGKEYGSIAPGDRVRIDRNGRLSINGQPKP